MAIVRPSIKGAPLPRFSGRTDKKRDPSPQVVGLDMRSSYKPGYRPEVGIFPTVGFLLQEDNYFILQESDEYIKLE